MKTRIIIQSSENGEVEKIYFTDNLLSPVGDFLSPNCSVDYDEVFEGNLPTGFPLNYTFTRD